jgi:hypothetical protein
MLQLSQFGNLFEQVELPATGRRELIAKHINGKCRGFGAKLVLCWRMTKSMKLEALTSS